MNLQMKMSQKDKTSELKRIKQQNKCISLNTYRRISKRNVVKDIKYTIDQTKDLREKKKKLLRYLESEMIMLRQKKRFIRKILMEFYR